MANLFQKIFRFNANPREKSLFYYEGSTSYRSLQKTNRDLREVLCDDEIGNALETRLDAIIALPWKLSGGDKNQNLFLYDELKKHIYEMLNYSWWALVWGKSAFQIVYDNKTIPGKVIVASVTDEDFYQFQLVKGVWLHNKKPFPEGKYFITTNKKSFTYPDGYPLALRLLDIMDQRCNGWDFFMKYLEKFGIPFFAIKLGENTNDEDVTKMQKFLEAKRPRGVILPHGVSMEVIDGKTTSAPIFGTFEEIMRERIARAVLGQTLTTGTSSTGGSLAQGEVHERVAVNKTVSDAIMIAPTINLIVKALYELNKFTGGLPIFQWVADKAIKMELAQRDQVLDSIGVRFDKQYFVDEYDLDAKQIEYTPRPKTSSGFSSGGPKHEFISQEKLKARASEAEKLEKKYIDDSPNLGAIIDDIVKTSKSKEEMESKLKSFLKKDSTEYDEALTEAMLKSSVVGSEDA